MKCTNSCHCWHGFKTSLFRAISCLLHVCRPVVEMVHMFFFVTNILVSLADYQVSLWFVETKYKMINKEAINNLYIPPQNTSPKFLALWYNYKPSYSNNTQTVSQRIWLPYGFLSLLYNPGGPPSYPSPSQTNGVQTLVARCFTCGGKKFSQVEFLPNRCLYPQFNILLSV